MNSGKKALLSIGIIFRNDIRSIERCLQALEPLRRAVSCQLIMADTGSTDGSREIAVRYADELFDFPWVNDFSAARNAVMDRAVGKWYLTVDCDEYLDGDFSELAEHLQRGKGDLAMVVQRNYLTYEMDNRYADCWAGRLVRMSSGLRYRERIHEYIPAPADRCVMLAGTVLHHDGYAELNDGTGGAKRRRNVSLLRESLREAPSDLRLHMQFIESGREEPDCLEVLRRACALVEAKKPGWREYGPSIFRHAVSAAKRLALPELDEWVRRAEEWFPDSYFTRIDAAYVAFIAAWERERWMECVQRGERFLQAKEDYRKGGRKQRELLCSTLVMASPQWELNLRLLLASAHLREDGPERTWELLSGLDGRELDASQAGNLALVLLELQAGSGLETAPLLLRLYGELRQPAPSEERGKERQARFLELAAAAFDPEYRAREAARPGFRRPSRTLLPPLADQCTLGLAAAMLESGDPAELGRLLREVERWDELPAQAMAHAVLSGAAFPPPDRPLNMEELDGLAGTLVRAGADARAVLERAVENDFSRNRQTLSWARAMALAAVQSCRWKEGEGDMDLARTFAEVERAFLPACYAPEALTEEGRCLLPPMHRFGWYCSRAFEALEAGDAAGYVRLLRQGLASCEGMGEMAEFLLEHTPELEAAKPSQELLDLARQVRAMLSAYPTDDPALAVLKSSPVYQRVAFLIEE
ncbi:MAG: glycosyltransferase [Oscillospiraceae bacterium]|nr:glycosyltransferase [Oscillospiraceae bacterium]